MSNKKGLIGTIIILVAFFLVIGFILVNVGPAAAKLGKGAEQFAVAHGILPEEYYNITPLNDWKGHLEFYVTDPYSNFETGFQFPSFEGYGVSDNKIPTQVTNVISHSDLYVAVVADNCSDTAYLDSLYKLNFVNHTYVGFFPTDSAFNQVSVASCSGTEGDYWTAIRNATYSLPAGGGIYKVLLIISDGLANPDDEAITDALQGLHRNDLNAVYILTSNPKNCQNAANVLNLTNAMLAELHTKFKGCFNKTLTDTIISDTIGGDVKTIKLDYTPRGDIGKHNVTVKVTKRPYSGRYTFINVNYG